MRIRLTLDTLEFDVALFVDEAPDHYRALLAALPMESQVVHAMWSGHMILATGVDLGTDNTENRVSILIPGDLVYHRRHKEIAIAYGEAQFREPIGPVYVSRIGRLEGDLTALSDLGSRVQLEGAKRFMLSRG
jgi:hypothetical protein